MTEIKTYPEMNKNIIGYLELMDMPITLYAAQRIKELETEAEDLENDIAAMLVDHARLEEKFDSAIEKS